MINEFGPPEVLKLQETALPLPGKNEVLVRVHASGINPVDYKIRNGSLKWVTSRKFPRILGFDIAGVVEKSGKRSEYKPGDRVFAMLSSRDGGYAEFVTVKEKYLARVPAEINMKEAAGTPLAALTALRGLRKGREITKGDRVLINGASGGVGSFAVQIARAMGAEVWGVCSTRNQDFVYNLGADTVIDYTSEDFTRLGTRFDKVFDAVAKSGFGRCKRILKKGGTYVTTNPGPGFLLQSGISILSSKKAAFILAKPCGDDLQIIADMISRGLVKPYVQQSFLLEEGPEAHKMIETQRVRGKIVFHLV